MISFLEGEIVAKDSRSAVVKSGGLGLRVFAAPSSLRKMPQAGEVVKLWTNLYFRDDRMELYGFLSQEELEFFEMLNSVAGVGPKSALAILDIGNVEKIKSAIASGDTAILTRVSGIGKKSAARIILELRPKVALAKMSPESLSIDLDAEEALVALGYSRYQVREALERVSAEITLPEGRVREALKLLGRK